MAPAFVATWRAVVRAICWTMKAKSVCCQCELRQTAARTNGALRALCQRDGRQVEEWPTNSVWWLNSPDDYLGRSPLLSASVFNFFSPFYGDPVPSRGRAGRPRVPECIRHPGGGRSTNFFSRMISDGDWFDDTNRVDFDTTPLGGCCLVNWRPAGLHQLAAVLGKHVEQYANRA